MERAVWEGAEASLAILVPGTLDTAVLTGYSAPT